MNTHTAPETGIERNRYSNSFPAACVYHRYYRSFCNRTLRQYHRSRFIFTATPARSRFSGNARAHEPTLVSSQQGGAERRLGISGMCWLHNILVCIYQIHAKFENTNGMSSFSKAAELRNMLHPHESHQTP
jgi:hypothetical protein